MGLQELLLILVFFMMVVVIRPIFLIAIMGKLRQNFSRKDVLIMSLVAPRGLSSAAMIPIVAGAAITIGNPELAGKMVNIVFMVILLSVLFSSVVAKIGGMERFQDKGEGKRAKSEEKPAPPVEKKDEGGDISLMLEKGKEEKDGVIV